MTTSEIEFVDDWSPLKEAVSFLAEMLKDTRYDFTSTFPESDIETVVKYVPLLIEQYSKLFELSLQLTAAWDAANKNRTPGGLIVEEFKL